MSDEEEAEESEEDLTCIKRKHGKYSKYKQYIAGIILCSVFKHLKELHVLFVTIAELIQNLY